MVIQVHRSQLRKCWGAEPTKVFICGGHVGRAYGNNLKDLAKQKQFSATQIVKWKRKFPEVEKA